MIVLDTSVVIELLLNLPLGPRVRDEISDPDMALHAPALLTVEVLQVLRRRVAAALTTADEAADAIGALNLLDVTYHDHGLLVDRIWSLRGTLTAYDAAYVALAELLGAVLLTADSRLARAPGHHARVELVTGSGG